MVVFLLWNIATRPECTLNGSKWDLKKRFFLLRFSQFTRRRRRRRKQKPKKRGENGKTSYFFFGKPANPNSFFFHYTKEKGKKKKIKKGTKKGDDEAGWQKATIKHRYIINYGYLLVLIKEFNSNN